MRLRGKRVNHFPAVGFEPEPGEPEEALGLMAERARFMARQPGFLSMALHRSLDGKRIVNCIHWKSRELLQSAHRSPEFRKEWSRLDDLTDEIDPHLYEEVDFAAGHSGRR
ncbi:MAG TPA: antibiotic biosynthesis monooxygenase family protein [Stellaceae bacterium]|nr:antibiotic biosynthesis monooxygenase family protein [Stellaceae bacterium]